MRGYYSREQAKLVGSVIYATPDGREVHVTEVVNDPARLGAWKDYVEVGEVAKYLREGVPPSGRLVQL